MFAPTDFAFEQLPPGVLPHLLANKTLLSEVLLYHVVAGNVSSSQLKDGQVVPTLDKQNLLINILPPHNNFPAAVLINRDSRVLYANNYATVRRPPLRPPPPPPCLFQGYYPLTPPPRRMASTTSLTAFSSRAP